MKVEQPSIHKVVSKFPPISEVGGAPEMDSGI